MRAPLNNSTPRAAKAIARRLSGSLVNARTAYGEGDPSALGASSASTTAEPCAPVAPMTRMSFLSDMLDWTRLVVLLVVGAWERGWRMLF